MPTCSLNSTDVLEYSLLFMFPEVVNFEGSQTTAHALCWLTERGPCRMSLAASFLSTSLCFSIQRNSLLLSVLIAWCARKANPKTFYLLKKKHNRKKKMGNILMKWEKQSLLEGEWGRSLIYSGYWVLSEGACWSGDVFLCTSC